jgi:hypothetical protein
MTRVTIKSVGDSPNAVEVSIDGHVVPGIESYQLTHSAKDGRPVVELRVLALALDIDLPDVVLKALDTSPRVDEFARRPQHGDSIDALLASAGIRMTQHEIVALAEQFAALPIPTALSIMRHIQIASADDVLAAELDPAFALVLTENAFLLALRTNVLDRFIAAIHAAGRGMEHAAVDAQTKGIAARDTTSEGT